MKFVRMSLATIILSICIGPAAQARLIQTYSYQERFGKSDLIVIAEPISKTADTNEKTYFDGLVRQVANGKQSKVAAIGVETTFEVLKIIKGPESTARFVLHHYRELPSEPSSGLPDLNGPAVVSFDPSDPSKRRDILLFLIKEKDGRYAPFGGQSDPGSNAIFALEFPR